MLSAIIVLICFALGVGFFWWWFITAKRFDAVLCAIYSKNREQWRALGQPMGFFWRPQDSVKFLGSTNSRNRLFFVFFFKPESLRLLSSGERQP